MYCDMHCTYGNILLILQGVFQYTDLGYISIITVYFNTSHTLCYHTVCTYGKLLKLLRPCLNKWYRVGFLLGLSVEELESLKIPGLTSEQQLQEMLKLKLMSGEEVTWGDIVIALLGAGEGNLAQEMARAHQNG